MTPPEEPKRPARLRRNTAYFAGAAALLLAAGWLLTWNAHRDPVTAENIPPA